MLPRKQGEPHLAQRVPPHTALSGRPLPSRLDSQLVSYSPAVEIRGLIKRYGGMDVVDRLDLTAARGELTAVLGPNGAGKTTTVECCEGLRKPDGGSTRVLGLNPLTSARELRPRVGVMLQDGGLPTGVRAQEMLAHVAKMYSSPRRIEELTERLGLGSFARTTVRRLSGGQRQRLALATAIVGRPEVIFLDEPSAGMDPQSRHAVWELIRELRADGASIILTTHLMDEAAQLADHVAIVDHGRVIAQGTVKELTSAQGEQVLNMTTAGPLRTAELQNHLDAAQADVPASGTFHVTALGEDRFQITGPLTSHVLASITTWCAENAIHIRHLDLGDRTLEDVFLDLTGRNLR